ncbi:MAG: glutamine synthetase type III, partial [Lachnospiraceae bacterium]|nr:glutamine synthetase type III [Lachnospiraceae bacterium]
VNVAVDHNQLTMEIMKKVATRHGMVCLLHEKPFEGVNGSGKHNNWSLQTDTGLNLLNPGSNPAGNLGFLLTLCAVIQAVDDYQELMRISVASAGNDHRLGGNEAPPAIMSMYLGDDITALLNSIAEGKPIDSLDRQFIDGGVGTLSKVTKDNTDRNRTSPLAFTGNKFEFRSVGSSFSVSDANVVINTAVADRFNEFSAMLESSIDVKQVVYSIVKQTVADHGRILYGGNNYSDEWIKEAKKRGLRNLKDTVSALNEFTSDKNIALFKRNGIFSEAEMISRREVMLENYAKVVNIEAHTLIDMVRQDVLPAVIKYTNLLSLAICEKQKFGLKAKAESEILTGLSNLTDKIWEKVGSLETSVEEASGNGVTSSSAAAFAGAVLQNMNSLRESVDQAEALTDSESWPYPGYGELLNSVRE